MRQILQPVYLAEKCSLQEAVHWIAFNIYPIESITGNNKDFREDLEYQDGYDIDNGATYFEYYTPEFSERYNLPKNYMAEYIGTFSHSYSEENIDECAKNNTFPKEETEKMRKDLQKRKELDTKQQVFREALEDRIEIPKSELFIALRKGNIRAYGRLLPSIEEQKKIKDFVFPEHEAISANLWKADNIIWDGCKMNVKNTQFIHILVDVESLLACFPEPEPKFVQVGKIHDTYILNNSEPIVINKGKNGRPPYNWKEFTQEMAARLTNNQLPSLQKICVIEMRDWCISNWGSPPSETNLKEHISPFYKAIKKSETK